MFLALLCVSGMPVLAQEKNNKVDPIATRELIRQWVQTERLISEEKNAWNVEKQRMQDLLALYQRELKLLDEELEKAGASAALADGRKEELESELADYRDAQRLLAATLKRFLPRAQGLIAKLPKPLKDELASDIELLHSPEAMQNPRDVLKSMLSVLTTDERIAVIEVLDKVVAKLNQNASA